MFDFQPKTNRHIKKQKNMILISGRKNKQLIKTDSNWVGYYIQPINTAMLLLQICLKYSKKLPFKKPKDSVRSISKQKLNKQLLKNKKKPRV